MSGVFSIPFGRASRQEIEQNVRGLTQKKGKKLLSANEVAAAHAHLITQPVHAKPDDISSITIDCSTSKPFLVENTKTGYHPRHLITTEDQLISIRLADGREVSVEVRIEQVADDHRLEDLYLAASLTELIDEGE